MHAAYTTSIYNNRCQCVCVCLYVCWTNEQKINEPAQNSPKKWHVFRRWMQCMHSNIGIIWIHSLFVRSNNNNKITTNYPTDGNHIHVVEMSSNFASSKLFFECEQMRQTRSYFRMHIVTKLWIKFNYNCVALIKIRLFRWIKALWVFHDIERERQTRKLLIRCNSDSIRRDTERKNTFINTHPFTQIHSNIRSLTHDEWSQNSNRPNNPKSKRILSFYCT